MQIEEGYFSFRVVGTNPQGEMQSWQSGRVFAHDYEHLKAHKADYLNALSKSGNTSLRITHVITEEPPAHGTDWQEYYYLD